MVTQTQLLHAVADNQLLAATLGIVTTSPFTTSSSLPTATTTAPREMLLSTRNRLLATPTTTASPVPRGTSRPMTSHVAPLSFNAANRPAEESTHAESRGQEGVAVADESEGTVGDEVRRIGDVVADGEDRRDGAAASAATGVPPA